MALVELSLKCPASCRPKRPGILFEFKEVLLSGDILGVVPDHQWVSFMYSYPNFIPLPTATVEKIITNLNGMKFNRLYDAFHLKIIEETNACVQESTKRYIDVLNGALFLHLKIRI
jgi:hypothetical protein